jgi:hypothetical protein
MTSTQPPTPPTPILTVHRHVLRPGGPSGVTILVDRIYEHASGDQVIRPVAVKDGLLHPDMIYRAPLGVSVIEGVQAVDITLRPTIQAWAFLVEVMRVDLSPSRELIAYFKVGHQLLVPTDVLCFEFWLRPPTIDDKALAALPVAEGADIPEAGFKFAEATRTIRLSPPVATTQPRPIAAPDWLAGAVVPANKVTQDTGVLRRE